MMEFRVAVFSRVYDFEFGAAGFEDFRLLRLGSRGLYDYDRCWSAL